MNDALDLLRGLAYVADADVGEAFEEPRGSNRGQRLQKFFKADDYDPPGKDEGYPWCAAAVSFWVQDFLNRVGGTLFKWVRAPRTASAFGLIGWARAAGCMVFTPRDCMDGSHRYAQGPWPVPGDIVVFTFSHCGIVKAAHSRAGTFTCIEGNTDSEGSREGWQVARKPRVFNQVKAFIRLTPKGEKL